MIKIFPENVGDGGVDVIFRKQKIPKSFAIPEISKIFSEEIFHFLKICNSSMPGPPPRKLGPPFLLFWHGPDYWSSVTLGQLVRSYVIVGELCA
jgi:hypothetical protein